MNSGCPVFIEKDALIAQYAKEKKRRQEESLSPNASAWKGIIEKLQKAQLKDKKKNQDVVGSSSHIDSLGLLRFSSFIYYYLKILKS